MKKFAAVIVVLLMASTASAALLQGYCADWQVEDGSVPGVWEYIDMTIWGKTHCVEYTADGSGIVGYLGQTEVLPDSTHKFDQSNGAWNTDWWQNGGMGNIDASREYLIQDLGQVYSLGNAYLWPYNQGDKTTVSVRDFNIMVSSDPDPRTATWTQVGATRTLNMAPAMGVDVTAQAFAMDVDARLVKIDILSAWGTAGWAGLSEFAFSEAEEEPEPVIPEPAGLGVVGLALLSLRKRRS